MIPRRLLPGPTRARASWPLIKRPTLQPSGLGNHLRKWETTATGEEKSGHICAGPNESILFYDNLFPLKLSYGWMSYLVGRPWGADQDLSNLLQKFNKSSLGIADPINLVKRGIPKDDSLVIELFFLSLGPCDRLRADVLKTGGGIEGAGREATS